MVEFRFDQTAESDFERLLALRLLVMRPHLERVGRFSVERATARFRGNFVAEHMRLVSVGSELAGCVALLPDEIGWELSNFYLYPAHQGRGLGSAIVTALTAEADAKTMVLHLQVLRQSPAVRLYERHGFVHTHDDDTDHYYRRTPK
jgi:GNAT superfamily N-acetyltransferase